MAKELLPDALCSAEAPDVRRTVVTGILFVLKMGIPWEYLPAEMGSAAVLLGALSTISICYWKEHLRSELDWSGLF